MQEITLYLIKGMIAFAMPIAWAAIFYRLVKKIQKGWPFLVVIASVLSVIFFTVKEIVDGYVAIDDIVAYLLGIFFSAAVISYFFYFRSLWLKVVPESDILYTKFKIKRGFHLRHILQMAVMVEEQGKDFYDMLAEKATNTQVKELCRKLANDEVEHKETFEKPLSSWLHLSIDNKTLALFDQELAIRGIFRNPPPPDSSIEEMVRYAIDQEKKMVDFYLSFEKDFPKAWKRIHIQKLVKEEKSHVSDLEDAYPDIST